ncbi:protein ANTAGONIST OF LIKE HETEROCHROMATIN PROTEIN 1-like [Sceloporus undulatus]|uniref:protein ANTAGONIST OF LIKE HETEROCHROMATIN PROTEIN 1-like n=1 Tax=Sceloporus undulatus TaxID=8520 RepID=UPI001C4D8E72|nr:protein ANTAGONIST OF LIKE HETEROCHROMATIN PROTEIN 1-like [Sceloporus undulatus]
MDPLGEFHNFFSLICLLLHHLMEQREIIMSTFENGEHDEDMLAHLEDLNGMLRFYYHNSQLSIQPMARRWWIYPKSDVHWNVFARTVWSDEMWKRTFRMPRAIFNMLVKELRPHLTRRDTRLRKAVPVEKQIAMAVMYLAHKGSYATVATFFGVGKSTAYRAIIHVFLCMGTHLLRRAVYLGDHRKVMAGFERLGFPQVVGAIDGCHIPIIAPAHEGAQYIKRKQTQSMILQATCDHNGIFLDLFTGFAGSNHDTFLLKESPIYHALKAGIYVPGRPTVTIAGK